MSPAWSSRSTRSPAGRLATMSARSLAGTVIAPSASILPGTQYVIPISRFVAVSLRPASSVRIRTLPRTGRVLRDETARLTTDRPRARFSCMTETFTSGSLRGSEGWSSEGAGSVRRVGPGLAAGLGAPGPWGGVGRSIHILERHHRHHAVDGVDDVEWPCGRRLFTTAARQWTRRPDSGTAPGQAVDHRECDPRPAPGGLKLSTRGPGGTSEPDRNGRPLSTPGDAFPPNRCRYPHGTARSVPRRTSRPQGWALG